MKYDLILVNGAPGIGKTTLCELLGEHYHSPVIDFGLIREFHLDKKWERKSDEEEEMSFKILQQILIIYLDHGLHNVFVNDLQEWRIDTLRRKFSDTNSLVLSLVTSDYTELKRRIESRNKGWRDIDEAWNRNQAIKSREPWPNELRIDVSVLGVNCAFQQVKCALEAHSDSSLPRKI